MGYEDEKAEDAARAARIAEREAREDFMRNYHGKGDPGQAYNIHKVVQAADEKAAAQSKKGSFNRDARKFAHNELAAVTDAAVRTQRRAGRPLTDEEASDLVRSVPKDLLSQAEELVKMVSKGGGDRVAADERAREQAVQYGASVKATWEPAAEAGPSTDDILASIPRSGA